MQAEEERLRCRVGAPACSNLNANSPGGMKVEVHPGTRLYHWSVSALRGDKYGAVASLIPNNMGAIMCQHGFRTRASTEAGASVSMDRNACRDGHFGRRSESSIWERGFCKEATNESFDPGR